MKDLENLMKEQQQQAVDFEDIDDDSTNYVESSGMQEDEHTHKAREQPPAEVEKNKLESVRNKKRHNDIKNRENVYENDREFLGGVNKAIESQTITIKDGSTEKEIPFEQESSNDNTKKIVSELVHVREYKNKAELEKQVFAKPREETGLKKKLMMSLIVCVIVGIFLGVQANSYYNFKEGAVTSALSCCFSWLMTENMPTSTNPLNTEIFMTGFGVGAGLLAIIILFIFLNNDEKKRSREGHEHGNSRLATPNDFKSYKNKFMER